MYSEIGQGGGRVPGLLLLHRETDLLVHLVDTGQTLGPHPRSSCQISSLVSQNHRSDVCIASWRRAPFLLYITSVIEVGGGERQI